MAILEPDVYFNANSESITDTGKKRTKLRTVPIRRTVLWEEEEIFLPAVYVGAAGVVLDICARIPVESMTSFLKKWNRERRLSLKTPEDYEEIDADNPGSRDFAVEVSLDGADRTRRCLLPAF